MPENSVKVDRSTKWGNPYVDTEWGVAANPEAVLFFVGPIAANCVEAYRLWLRGELIQAERLELYRQYRREILDSLEQLRGKNLACWCPLDAPCHADVLLEIANRD